MRGDELRHSIKINIKRERTMSARLQNFVAILTFFTVAIMASAAGAQKKYDPGASDTEIKIGNIMPYSGPASSYGVIGKSEAAYFNKINAEGGINGRKINFISYDDAYSPPKAIEQARRQPWRRSRDSPACSSARLRTPECDRPSPAPLRGLSRPRSCASTSARHASRPAG